jgi:hypothetical protein
MLTLIVSTFCGLITPLQLTFDLIQKKVQDSTEHIEVLDETSDARIIAEAYMKNTVAHVKIQKKKNPEKFA